MKILHTADWHLGHEFYSSDRAAEHDVFLNWLAEEIRARRPEVIIIAGDIYHSVNPSIRAQKQFYRALSTWLEADPVLQIVVIGGNHDSAARLEMPLDLAPSPRLSIVGALPQQQNRRIELERCILPLRHRSGDVGAVCLAVPFLRPGDLQRATADFTDSASAEAEKLGALYTALSNKAAALCGDVPQIATGHLAVQGAAPGAESERPVLIGGEEAVGRSVFPASLAYVALGHLHRPQTLRGGESDVDAARPLLRYAGSPFPLSLSETAYVHSLTWLTIAGDGPTAADVQVEETPIPRPAAFIRLPATGSAPLDELEAQIEALDPAPHPDTGLCPYLELAVALDEPRPDLRERIDRALAGKPVRLTRIQRHSSGASSVDRAEDTPPLSELSPSEVFQRLFAERSDTGGQAPSRKLRVAFDELRATLAGGGAFDRRDGAEDTAR
ncbi:MAG: exonuclease SbcCD subunit D C-terminal domain-containing protein [Pseudomonadota bacterium]